jgi:hypothetical protein
MDKQRLLELAGITEAKLATEPWDRDYRSGYVVVYIDSEGFTSAVWGTFDSYQDAEAFLQVIAKKAGYDSYREFEAEFDQQEPLTIERIDQPREAFGSFGG